MLILTRYWGRITESKNTNTNCDFDEASKIHIYFKMRSHQSSGVIFKLKLSMDVWDGSIKLVITYLPYYNFLTALFVEFWREIPNGNLDRGLCQSQISKALDWIILLRQIFYLNFITLSHVCAVIRLIRRVIPLMWLEELQRYTNLSKPWWIVSHVWIQNSHFRLFRYPSFPY